MGTELILPIIVTSVICIGLIKKTDVSAAFTEGAKDGLHTTAEMLPVLLLVLSSVTAFRASGGMDALIWLISPLTNLLKIPAEVIPLAVIKPFSGSGATAMLNDILSKYGTEGYIPRLAAVIAASSETTFYVISVYLGNSVRKCGKLLFCALASDVAAVIIASVITRYI